MLELEVPELIDGTVELRAIAREAGSKLKLQYLVTIQM